MKNIHFPVYTNDGPHGGGTEMSMLDVICRNDGIVIKYYLHDGSVMDESVIVPGEKIKSVKSEFKLLWNK